MLWRIGNTSSNALSIVYDIKKSDNPETIELNAQTHTKPVDLHCKTYKDQVYVGEKTFTSVYTATPPTNIFTFDFDSTFNMIACSANGITFNGDLFAVPMPAGKAVSYTFYKDYATAATETKPAQDGGIVMTFKADQKISGDDYFEIQVLPPFAKFSSKPDAKCVVDPPVEDFTSFLQDAVYLSFAGSFDANQKYVVTCPDSKVVLSSEQGPYTVATSAYYNDQAGGYYQNDIKKIEFANAASFTAVLGSIVLAASALAALF